MVDAEFVKRRSTEVVLADGTRVLLRPVVAEDKERILAAFERMSPASRRQRFMSPVDELTPGMLTRLTEIDYVDHFAWVAIARGEPGDPGVGVSRYVRLPDEPEVAEAAVTVIDEYQGRGLGTFLLQALGAVALENGIERFRSYILEDNRQIREVLEATGARLAHDSPGLVRVDVELSAREDEVKSTQAYGVLRALARGEGPPLIRWGALWSPPRA